MAAAPLLLSFCCSKLIDKNPEKTYAVAVIKMLHFDVVKAVTLRKIKDELGVVPEGVGEDIVIDFAI